MNRFRRSSLRLFLLLLCVVVCRAGTPRALVSHAPSLNGGRLEGELQILLPENITLNGGMTVAGDLFVPGTPLVVLNGSPSFLGVVDGVGSSAPANHRVTLNGGLSLGHLVRRTDAVALPSVSVAAAPTGSRSVFLNTPAQAIGDFSTLRNLTLNGSVGDVAVPPGCYGNFTANGSNRFVLGIRGGTTPASYSFQTFMLNGQSQIVLAGPVVVTMGSGIALNGSAGSEANPRWLKLVLPVGGLILNGNAAVFGMVHAPGGPVILNGGTRLVGGVACDRLTLNGNASLRIIDLNAPPSANFIAPEEGASVFAHVPLVLSALASDVDGTIRSVEFRSGEETLGNGVLENTSGEYRLSLAGGLAAGAYLLTVRATDDAGAVTVSSPRSLNVVMAPNVPPQVTITAPRSGTVLRAFTPFSATARATDSDGSIARVAFFSGEVLLGEPSGASAGDPAEYTLDVSGGLQPGTHRLSACAYDDRMAYSRSDGVQLRALPTLPYMADFEGGGGYAIGPLAGQLGWVCSVGDASVVAQEAHSGAQALVLHAGTTAASVEQEFAPDSGSGIVYCDVYCRATGGGDFSSAFRFAAGGAQFAFLRDGGQARVWVRPGDGSGNAPWCSTDGLITLGSDGVCPGWKRVTVRLDYRSKTWDLYLDAALVVSSLAFSDGADVAFARLSVCGCATTTTLLDSLLVSTENPLFSDNDADGMDDAWEAANGLNASDDDRNGDADGDGLTNLAEYMLGTRPDKTDTDGDGLPDGWEVKHKLNPLQASAAGADTDGDGLTDVQEYIRGTNPRLSDTDGDGMSDLWETANGLDPLSGADAAADADGDGVPNVQEFLLGTNPSDYFNGVLPVATVLTPDGSLGQGDTLSLLVADASGRPLANAPVTFRVKEGTHLLAAAADGPGAVAVTVRSGSDGVALVYVKKGGN